MLSNTKRSPKIVHPGSSPASEPDKFPFNRKRPGSESSTWRAGWVEPSSPLNTPPPPELDTRVSSPRMADFSVQERLLNAREVAARWVCQNGGSAIIRHVALPNFRGVKLGTLMRYRRADVEEFMERLTTSRSSFQ